MTTHTKNRTLFLVLSAVSAALVWFFRPSKSANVSNAPNTAVDVDLLDEPTPVKRDPADEVFYHQITGVYPLDDR